MNPIKTCFFITLFVLGISQVSIGQSDEAIRARANEIHQRILTVDTHVDTPLQMMNEDFDISKRNDPRGRGAKLDFPRMREGGLDAAFFAVFIGQGPLTPEGYEAALRRSLEKFVMIRSALHTHSDQVGLALTSADAMRLKRQGKLAIYIGVENAFPINHDLSLIQTFYDLGARYIGLTHSLHNQVADASTDESGPLHNGLSDFGKEVVREMNRLGMIIDVSHLSDEAFYDVLRESKAPVIASHSNVRELANHPRNIDDDMIRALAANGGVLQLSILSDYVKELPSSPQRDSAMAALRQRYNNFQGLTDEQMDSARRQWFEISARYPRPLATVADLVDHIDHVVQLVGIDFVGIGTDFDGGGALKDCFHASELGNITLELVRRGYSRREIEKIWSGNFLRVFRENERLARRLARQGSR
ncbi:MAG TPA: membrane dipeptidase [Bacteroidales bacterium]|nr:membrane dipeptidase [Bacteroidales bacterium]